MGDKHPKVAVVSVSKNDPEGLHRTHESVMGQEYANLTHIIALGASDDSFIPDGGLDRTNCPTTVLSGPDQGIYFGMNRALAAVPEDALVWYLNAGDFFLSEDSVSTAVAALGDANWVGGPVVLLHETGRIHGISEGGPTRLLGHRGALHLPAQPSILMRKTFLPTPSPFSQRLRLASDAVLFHNLASREWPSWYSDPLVGFVLGGRSSTGIRLALRELWTSLDPAPLSVAEEIRITWQALKTSARSMALLARHLPPFVRGVDKLDSSHLRHWREHSHVGGSLECCLSIGQANASRGLSADSGSSQGDR